MFAKITSFFPLILGLLSVSPASSLTQEEIAAKLDTVIVFSPVDSSSSSPSPQPITYELDGKVRSVFFASFSPSAVRQVIDERLSPQGIKDLDKIKFAPFSLAKFDSMVLPELNSNENARVMYVPDPAQVPFAERLLTKQGSTIDDAKKVSASMPVVFCPSPTITVTPKSGPLKGQSFIPCSTDYSIIKSTVDKAISENSKIKDMSLQVVAIPITNFAKVLSKSSGEEVSDFRILSNPANVEAINQLRDSR